MASDIPPSTFGALILEDRCRSVGFSLYGKSLWAATGLAILLLLIIVVPRAAIVGWCLIALAVVGAAVVFHRLGRLTRYAFYENGMTLGGDVDGAPTRQIAYTDLASFACHGTALPTNGFAPRAWVKFSFHVTPGRGEDVTYLSTKPPGAAEAIALRERLAAFIGQRMAEEWSRAGEVRWTDRLRLTRDGIAVDHPKSPRTIPYAAVERTEFAPPRASELGVQWVVYVGGESEPALRQRVNEMNFFPGLWVMEKARSQMAMGQT